MRTVALANLTRFTLVLNLPSDLVPEMSSRGVVGTRAHDPKTGERSVRAHRRAISGSVTLMPKGMDGDIVRGLPESVLKAPDVDRALKMWPPKLAAKTLNKDEREAEEKELAAADEKRQAEAKAAAELQKTRERRLAEMAGAKFEDEPAAKPEKSKAERVARGAKE